MISDCINRPTTHGLIFFFPKFCSKYLVRVILSRLSWWLFRSRFRPLLCFLLSCWWLLLPFIRFFAAAFFAAADAVIIIAAAATEVGAVDVAVVVAFFCFWMLSPLLSS
jgi:hypothetical protein